MCNGNASAQGGALAPTTMKRNGFTIVELMVGLAVGIILLLIVAQSYTMYEGKKRTTTGGADAQENGLSALRALQSDMRQGGAGFVSSQGTACPSYVNGNGTANPLLPVQIIDGGGTANDTIVVTYGTTPAGGDSAMILEPPTGSATAATIAVQAPATAFKPQDILLLSDPGGLHSCTMVQVASISTFGATRVTTTAYPSGSNYSFPAGVTYGPGDAPIGGYVFNMGSMVSNQYQVLTACSALVVSNALPGTPSPSCTMNPETFTNTTAVADSIVALQAQYGIAPAGSQTVNCWVNANNANTCDTADWSAAGLLASPGNIQRIKAIRIAVVARNNQQEKVTPNGPVTPNAPVLWPGLANQPAPTVNLSSNPNWQNFRYKVYTTIVPLKNVIWAQI